VENYALRDRSSEKTQTVGIRVLLLPAVHHRTPGFPAITPARLLTLPQARPCFVFSSWREAGEGRAQLKSDRPADC